MFYLGKSVEYLISGIIVIAIVAVIVSRNSTTPGVLQAFGAAMSKILANIVAPIAGTAQTSSNTSGNIAQAAASGQVTVPSNAVGALGDPLQAVTAATQQSAPAGTTAATTSATETDPHGANS